MTDPRPDLGRLRIDRSQATDAPRRALGFTVGLALLALLFIAAVYLYLRPRGGLEVQTARVEISGAGNGGAGITATGYVVARTRASVSSKVSGRLARLLVEEGSRVRRGEVMASLENADYLAALDQAVADSGRTEAALAEAVAGRDQLQRDLTRARDLLSRNLEAARTVEDLGAQLAASEARVKVAAAQVRAAAASVAFAKANLENTYIRAPFDGTVLRKDAEVGEVVAPMATGGGLIRGAVVTMADLATLEVEVDVNEAYIAQIRAGQPTRIVLDAYPQVGFAGRVRQIVPTADRQKATVQVKVSISDRDPRILPEMGARVEFQDSVATGAATEKPRLFIPADAVAIDGGASIVWVVREGVVNRTVIEAGPVSGGRREVRSGLSGGETIVIKPPSTLANGDRVNVTPR